jgi:hypothetical protein
MMKQLAHHSSKLQTPTFTFGASDSAYLTGEQVAAARARALPQVGPARFDLLSVTTIRMTTGKFVLGDQVQLYT